MPRRVVWVLLVLVALGACPRTAAACTPAVRAEILRRVVLMMPPSLAGQLKRHERELQSGALDDVRHGGVVYSSIEPGEGDRLLVQSIRETTRLIDNQAPMSEVARSFGEVARRAADLSFALYVGPHDPRSAEIQGDFCTYVERKLPKIAFTFAGYVDDDLARSDLDAFARNTAALARRDYPGILRSYFPEGRRPVPQDFDDRSVAFASASLEVSLALTRTARAWLFAWNEAHGDLTGTPFLVPPETRP